MNLRDFPAAALAAHHVQAVHLVDAFVAAMDAALMEQVVRADL